ncbi:MAG TPA: hypothetical protein VHF08_04930 [Nitrososphaeraceae archaeon]|nr:hypothetical protein [Nitrososphaeraceae archaeon]
MNESKNRTDAITKYGRRCINSKHSNMIKHIQQPEIKQTHIISRRTVVAEEQEKTNNLEKCIIKLQFMVIVLILCNIMDKKNI